MSRISLLWAREIGECHSTLFRTAEESQRVYDFQLSLHCEVQNAHTSGINSMHLDPQEGRYLLSGSSDKTVAIYDTWNCTQELKYRIKPIAVVGRPQHSKFAHKYSISSVQWYQHDSAIFTTSSADQTVKIWDSNSLRPAETFRFKSTINMHAMSTVTKSHNLIAVATAENAIYLADMRTGTNSHIMRGHRKAVLCLAWSPRNDHVLVSGSEDNRLLLWDVRQARGNLLSFDQHNGREAKTRKETSAHQGFVNGLRFTNDGFYLLSTGTDNRMRLWDAHSGRNTLTNYGRVDNDFRTPIQMAFISDSSVAFVPNNKFILMLNVHDGDVINKLIGHFNRPVCCEYNRYAQELYSGGKDNNILVWSAPLSPNGDEVTTEDMSDVGALEEPSSSINPFADSWSDDESD